MMHSVHRGLVREDRKAGYYLFLDQSIVGWFRGQVCLPRWI
jgi:hypothetical protein